MGMAKKQTRRCVSLNRLNYEVLRKEADRRGMTIAGLVEFALAAIGVPMTVHPQQSPELVKKIVARRTDQMRARIREAPVTAQELS